MANLKTKLPKPTKFKIVSNDHRAQKVLIKNFFLLYSIDKTYLSVFHTGFNNFFSHIF